MPEAAVAEMLSQASGEPSTYIQKNLLLELWEEEESFLKSPHVLRVCPGDPCLRIARASDQTLWTLSASGQPGGVLCGPAWRSTTELCRVGGWAHGAG